MAAAKIVTYEGTTNASQNSAESVEIDGVTLVKGEPVGGLSAEQIGRLEGLSHHKFTVEALGDDELLSLTREQLNEKAREVGVPDPESRANKQEVADAIRAREGDGD